MANQPENGLSAAACSSSQNTTPNMTNGSSLSTVDTSNASPVTAFAQLPDAKSLLNLLGSNQLGQANLQQVLTAAAAVSSSTSSIQRLPTLKPTVSPSLVPTVTTPTQITPVSGRKRGRPPASDQEDSVKRKRSTNTTTKGTGEKQNKGLRHFSQLVCEKVREKGVTTYNEVADELVKELGEAEKKAGQDGQIDQKNIRRRVYDALNVLMAMNIINKEKKEIHWIGLPTNSVQECEHIQGELSAYEDRITKKTAELHELVIQILTLKNLIKRNRERAEVGDSPSQHSAIGLPFILVNTNKQTTIDCSISSDKSEYVFTFDSTFELHQDVDVLKKMGMDCGLQSGQCTAESLATAKGMLPKIFEPVLDEMAQISLLNNTVPQSPVATSLPAVAAPVPSQMSTPASHLSANAAATLLTPLLSEHSNGTSSTISANSPLALAAAALVNSQIPASVAAALSTIQQLQQQQQQQLSSPLMSSAAVSQALTSPSQSPTSFRGGTVTARPLNFAPSPLSGGIRPSTQQPTSQASQSPLLKAQGMPSTTGTLASQSKSPGAKVVTVQPLPAVSMAEVLASLQQNMMSSLLRQQQQLLPTSNSDPVQYESTTPVLSSSSNGLPSNTVPSELHPLPPVTQPEKIEQASNSINSFLTLSNPSVSY